MQSYSKSELRQIIHQINSLYPHVDALVTTLMQNCVDAFGYPMPEDREDNETDILGYINESCISDDYLHQCLHDLHEIGSLVGKVQHGTLETETVKPYLVKYSLDNFATENAVIYAQPATSPMNDSRFDHAQEFLGNRFGKPVVIISISEITVVEGN